MSIRLSIIPLTVQKKQLATNELEVKVVSRWLRSRSLLGRVLRVLVRRLKHPGAPYTDRDLAILLLISVAQERR